MRRGIVGNDSVTNRKLKQVPQQLHVCVGVRAAHALRLLGNPQIAMGRLDCSDTLLLTLWPIRFQARQDATLAL